MKKLSETLRSSLSNLMPLSNNEKIEVLHYIFNQEQEIERLNNALKEKDKEIERLSSIIKEIIIK